MQAFSWLNFDVFGRFVERSFVLTYFKVSFDDQIEQWVVSTVNKLVGCFLRIIDSDIALLKRLVHTVIKLVYKIFYYIFGAG